MNNKFDNSFHKLRIKPLHFQSKRCNLVNGNHLLGNTTLRRLLGDWGFTIVIGGEQDGNYSRT